MFMFYEIYLNFKISNCVKSEIFPVTILHYKHIYAQISDLICLHVNFPGNSVT